MRKITTLVVDDEQILCQLIATVLEDVGHRVLTAFSGTEALARLETEPVDLVISDIVMPEIDGIELVQRIRAKHPTVRIISMSGGGSYLTAALCLKLADQMGASVILSKPFTPAQLVEAVQRALTGFEPTPPAAA